MVNKKHNGSLIDDESYILDYLRIYRLKSNIRLDRSCSVAPNFKALQHPQGLRYEKDPLEKRLLNVLRHKLSHHLSSHKPFVLSRLFQAQKLEFLAISLAHRAAWGSTITPSL